ncbi:hypothetical protein AX15_000775 [Amanita polypyramis BW_CC]|nr:hypothetical protein AX15_000775 [Amanita polypyramis BW_CC]
MLRPRKRKQRTEHRRIHPAAPASAPDPRLFVVAHEADIVRGPQATLAAKALEVGDALIRWGASSDSGRLSAFLHDMDEDDYRVRESEGTQREIWVDRYDARLLLDALPPVQPVPQPPRAESPSGWSDLPSDTEDTFFFSPDEVEDYRREKRRRTLDKAYEERLKARMAEDEDEGEEHDIWGGSDEEPDDTQKELMRRTATHLQSSPNPAQLEMRILANHGADKRFAFLRGRWSHAWRLTKSKARQQAEEEAAKDGAAREDEALQPSSSLGALAGYGDSDESDSHSHYGNEVEPADQGAPARVAGKDETPLDGVEADGASIKEARRARAKIWAESRRLARDSP